MPLDSCDRARSTYSHRATKWRQNRVEISTKGRHKEADHTDRSTRTDTGEVLIIEWRTQGRSRRETDRGQAIRALVVLHRISLVSPLRRTN